MEKYYKDKHAEQKIAVMEEIIKSKKFEKGYIRELVARQKGELSVFSQYYERNIAEGNWSLIEEDLDIKKLDRFDGEKEIFGEVSERKKDAEYEYVFIPSYYAFKILILYFEKDPTQSKRIYGLKNAINGGLSFILKYIGGDFKDDRIDFATLIEKLFDFQSKSDADNDYINDIIDCLNNFYGKNLILERRIRNFNESKENWFCIDFYKETEKDEDLLSNYTLIEDYKILMHRDVKKDWKHLEKQQIKKAKEKISKTPLHPYNNFPKDSEKLKGNLKGWFSQRISEKDKDRIVYKIEQDKKIVYIATVCDHYKDAPGRTKSMVSYR